MTDTWTCECGNHNDCNACVRCGKARPVEMTEEERDLPRLEDFSGRLEWLMAQIKGDWVGRPEVEVVKRLRAARAPLVEKLREAEERNERTMDESNRLHDELREARRRIAELEGHGKPSAGLPKVESQTPAPAAAPAEVTTENLKKVEVVGLKFFGGLVLGPLKPLVDTQFWRIGEAQEAAVADIRANLARAEERHRARIAELAEVESLKMAFKSRDEGKMVMTLVALEREVKRLTRELDEARVAEEAKKDEG